MAEYRVGAARGLPIVRAGVWDGAGAVERIFAWAGGERFAPSKARRAFLVYDAGAANQRGAYRLPFADVVEGRLVAVEAGLRAAAAMLGQTEAPAGVLTGARRVIEGYVARMEGRIDAKEATKGAAGSHEKGGGGQMAVDGGRLSDYRVSLAGEIVGDGVGESYDVVIIRAGVANGWTWPGEVLQGAVDEGQFEQLTSFVDHRNDPTVVGRSVRDVCGVIYDGAWDPEREAVVGHFRPTGPQGPLAREVVRESLAERESGEPTPPIGLSIDVGFQAEGRRVTRIARVYSGDLVWNPAAGGEFTARLAGEGNVERGAWGVERDEDPERARQDEQNGMNGGEGGVEREASRVERAEGEAWVDTGEGVELGDEEDLGMDGEMDEGTEKVERGAGSGERSGVERGTGNGEREGERGALAVTEGVAEEARRAMMLARGLLQEQCRATLAAALLGCDLPEAMREEVRGEFEGRVFEPAELQGALVRKRGTLARLVEAGVVRGMGEGANGGWQMADGGRQKGGGAVVSGMRTDLERLGLAFERLMGVAVPEGAGDVPRLTGIREAYHLLTGDYDMYGVFNAERAAFANANATTMAGLVANAMNKIIPTRSAELGRAGYDWWKKIVYEEDLTTLQDIRWITVGGFGDLPTVQEGAAYTELVWDDSTETTVWVKKGGYVGLTMEMIDRDETRRARMIPQMLATAGVRTLSGAVAGLFTMNSGAGPDLADTTATFHASRGNVGTTALSATSWDAAVQAMFKITELNSGKRLGIRPRYVLAPIELEKGALQIFVSDVEPTSNAFYDNVRRSMAENVVIVPEWTDANDWAAVADPQLYPGVGVAYRFGRQPEVFVADQPEVGSMFTNDELRVKVRFFFAVGIVDYRPLYKANVA